MGLTRNSFRVLTYLSKYLNRNIPTQVVTFVYKDVRLVATSIPGSLSPTNALYEEPTKVQVTRTPNTWILEGSGARLQGTWFAVLATRAGMIGQLEQQKVITFGLEPPMGWMVGWPSTLTKGLEGRL